MEHEGMRVLPRGKSPGRQIAEVFGCLLVVVLVLTLLGVTSVVGAIVGLVVSAVVLSVLVLRMARCSVQITSTQVRVRQIFGTVVIPRDQIADVVLIRDLVDVEAIVAAGGRVAAVAGTGHLAIVDAAGRPLWRTATADWTQETIDALMASGPRSTVVDHSSPPEVREAWASLVPVTVARPGLSAIALLVYVVVVLGALVGLYLYVS